MTEEHTPAKVRLADGLGPNAQDVARDPCLTWTHAQRCDLAEQCLPKAEYRTRLERLHADMLAEIERLRSAMRYQDARDGRIGTHGPGCYSWGPGHYECALGLVTRAPVAIMDTRTALGLCAPTEADFPALYALQGHRVALVDLGTNV